MLRVPIQEAQLCEQYWQVAFTEYVPTGHEVKHSLLKRDPQQAEQLVHLLGWPEHVRHGELHGTHLVLSEFATEPGGHVVGQYPLYSNLPGLQIVQMN